MFSLDLVYVMSLYFSWKLNVRSIHPATGKFSNRTLYKQWRMWYILKGPFKGCCSKTWNDVKFPTEAAPPPPPRVQLCWNQTSAKLFGIFLLHIFRPTFTKNTSGWLLLSPEKNYEGFHEHYEVIKVCNVKIEQKNILHQL